MQKTYTADLKKQSHATKVLIAVSGGMDSAVAAALLKTQGFELHGIFLQMVDPSSKPFAGYCSRCASHTQESARNVCEKLDFSFRVLDAQGSYQAEVIDHLVHESLQQRAPRACFKCNQEVIFKSLIDLADQLGCPQIATGHYAQLIQDTITGQAVLSKAADTLQDQSHLLSGLTQETLKRCLFPLGTLSHTMVEKLAREMEVDEVVSKNTAQGGSLCFPSRKNYAAYVETHAAEVFRPAGVVRTAGGEIVGAHTGLHQFMIGQCADKLGTKLSLKDAEQFHVSSFDLTNQSLIVSEKASVSHQLVIASQVNWLRSVSQIKPFRCQARITGASTNPQSNAEVNCRVTVYENSTIQIELDESVGALSPGNSIVFYDMAEVLGSAVIERAGPLEVPAK